jgi:hypothetical protein
MRVIFLGLLIGFKPPTSHEIAHYKEVAYPKWLTSVRTFFASLARHLELRSADVEICLTNTGGAPAEHAMVEFLASKGIVFRAPHSNGGRTIRHRLPRLPPPPKAPAGRNIDLDLFGSASMLAGPPVSIQSGLLDHHHQLFSAIRPQARDRNEFYWKPARPSRDMSAWTFECEEFRHNSGIEAFPLKLVINRNYRTEKGAVTYVVTARNMVQPANFTLPLRVHHTRRDLAPRAREILEAADPFDA